MKPRVDFLDNERRILITATFSEFPEFIQTFSEGVRKVGKFDRERAATSSCDPNDFASSVVYLPEKNQLYELDRNQTQVLRDLLAGKDVEWLTILFKFQPSAGSASPYCRACDVQANVDHRSSPRREFRVTCPGCGATELFRDVLGSA